MTEKPQNKEIYERMAKVETRMDTLSKSVDEIKNNHLKHIDEKIDLIGKDVVDLRLQIKEIGVKIGFIFAIGTSIAQFVIQYFFK